MARKPTPAGAAASTPAADTTNNADNGTTTTGDNAGSDTDTTGDNAGSGADTASDDAGSGTDTSSSTGEQTGSEPFVPGLAAAISTTVGALTNDTPSEPQVEVGTIEVRILLDHGDHQPNDVALLTPAELRFALAAGWADPDPTAIAFAKSLVA